MNSCWNAINVLSGKIQKWNTKPDHEKNTEGHVTLHFLTMAGTFGFKTCATCQGCMSL